MSIDATTDNAIVAENVNTDNVTDNINTANNSSNEEVTDEKVASPKGRWPWSGRNKKAPADPPSDNDVEAGGRGRPTKWSMGVLNDPRTHEVPGMSSTTV